MTEGMKLSRLIKRNLDVLELSIADKHAIETHEGGTYEPDSLFEALEEIDRLAGDVRGLIRLYKLLPLPLPEDAIIYNGKQVSNVDYVKLRASGVDAEEFVLPARISRTELTMFTIPDRRAAAVSTPTVQRTEVAPRDNNVQHDGNKQGHIDIDSDITHINGISIADILKGV